ncbi:Alfin [Arabidopsis thaliana x Arabidopsis arenosa]|uniref:PHD finger protein ALFIN-LIKE n=1 Tax=Arabidopsis thaliana x Arabidopsis arenosa TaxID=1240361 RepID=A0A8T1Z0R0_9BRAS|nr:Alfin [Arabidopsis thaliana x Arabidopsis arenosa]
MDAGGAYNPRTVEEVFRDFKGRRAGMIKALTTDVQEFFRLCDPDWDYSFNHLVASQHRIMDFILAFMVFQTTIYYIWREQNSRQHQRG